VINERVRGPYDVYSVNEYQRRFHQEAEDNHQKLIKEGKLKTIDGKWVHIDLEITKCSLSLEIDGGFSEDDSDEDWSGGSVRLRNYLEFEENIKDYYKKYDFVDAIYDNLESLTGYSAVVVENDLDEITETRKR
jgi:hypothetical protein